MIDYIRKHDRYVSELLEKNPGQEALRELLTHHDKQIAWMQHERLAHLMTMLFVCLFFLLAFGFTMIHFVLPYMLLTALLLILSVAYILHYYRLENSIQRWYVVSNRIRDNCFNQNKKSPLSNMTRGFHLQPAGNGLKPFPTFFTSPFRDIRHREAYRAFRRLRPSLRACRQSCTGWSEAARQQRLHSAERNGSPWWDQ
jgi:hypothetical protein